MVLRILDRMKLMLMLVSLVTWVVLASEVLEKLRLATRVLSWVREMALALTRYRRRIL